MMGTGSRGRLKSKTQGQTSLSPAIFANLLLILAGYRMKMPVTEVMLFPDGNGYYVCPRCHVTMEREFMHFCDRCGQHLPAKRSPGVKKQQPAPGPPHNRGALWLAGAKGGTKWISADISAGIRGQPALRPAHGGAGRPDVPGQLSL